MVSRVARRSLPLLNLCFICVNLWLRSPILTSDLERATRLRAAPAMQAGPWLQSSRFLYFSNDFWNIAEMLAF